MIAIIVHQVISITSKLIADLFNNSSHLFFIKIGVPNLYTLPVRYTETRTISSMKKFLPNWSGTWIETVRPTRNDRGAEFRKFHWMETDGHRKRIQCHKSLRLSGIHPVLGWLYIRWSNTKWKKCTHILRNTLNMIRIEQLIHVRMHKSARKIKCLPYHIRLILRALYFPCSLAVIRHFRYPLAHLSSLEMVSYKEDRSGTLRKIFVR